MDLSTQVEISENRVLQQNQKFIRAEAVSENEIGLHSFEGRRGVIIPKETIERFSKICSESCNHLIDEIVERLHSEVGDSVPRNALAVLVRRAIFPLTHFYWNQVMRLQSSFLSEKAESISVYSFENRTEKDIQTPEEFERLITAEPEFNEFFIFYLSKIWDLHSTSNTEATLVSLNLHSKIAPKNNLFALGKGVKLGNRFIGLMERIFKRFYPFSKFPVLTFANSETALRLRGMYLFSFRLMTPKWSLSAVDKDQNLRERIFDLSKDSASLLSDFFIEMGLNEKRFLKADELFRKFLITYFPVQFLERLTENYAASSDCFFKNDRKAILSSGDGDTFSTYAIAYAKANGFKIIKAQHGGHYGYYKDNRPALDIELPATDVFLTWGWTRMHEGSQLNHIQCIPMPSPWLSERKKYWKQYRIGEPKTYDLLWMPQMMKRFVGAPQGASSIRRDVIEEFSNSMLELAESIREKKLKAFVKPYNTLTVALMEQTYRKLREIGDEYITVSYTYDKGLTIDLIQDCSIVLWDQPGTGFLECLSGGIPTLVFWNRLYCEEEEWTRVDFEILERNGIVHRSIDTLTEEAVLLLKDPVAWMENSERKQAIDSFRKKYALTSEDWSADWKVYLKSLK
ncbi:transferase [Leptospira barantonii]|nr:transferase [Leptospira barantonii]